MRIRRTTTTDQSRKQRERKRECEKGGVKNDMGHTEKSAKEQEFVCYLLKRKQKEQTTKTKAEACGHKRPTPKNSNPPPLQKCTRTGPCLSPSNKGGERGKLKNKKHYALKGCNPKTAKSEPQSKPCDKNRHKKTNKNGGAFFFA